MRATQSAYLYNSFVFRRKKKSQLYQVLCKLHFAIYIVSLCHVFGLRLIKILFCSLLFYKIDCVESLKKENVTSSK